MTFVDEPQLREGASAILTDLHGRLLLQQRDTAPDIRDSGKVSLFGGRREGEESFLDCIVREVHEEIGYYVPPSRFARIARWSGPDYAFANVHLHGVVFLAQEIPVQKLMIAEGHLVVIAPQDVTSIWHTLAPPAQFALGLVLDETDRTVNYQGYFASSFETRSRT